jgi:hypothetical protein
MSDPIARPGNDDPGIQHATDEVVETWKGATDGKQPAAGSEDFERMRDGFGEAAADEGFTDAPTREEQLAHSDPAAPGQTAANRATSQSGPDA